MTPITAAGRAVVLDDPLAGDFDDPLAGIRALGLAGKVADLDAYGYAVIRPHEWDDGGLTQRIIDAVLALSQNKTGIKPDLAVGASHVGTDRAVGQHMWNLLAEDAVFSEAVTHDVPYAMTRYLLGDDANLSSVSAMIRGPGTPALELHTDMVGTPEPFAAYAQVMNINWTLTDYSPDNGSTCFWPGSHRFCRRPTAAEMAKTDRFVAVTAPTGSLIVWHGNTWHGSLMRKSPGLRMQLIMFFCRNYLLPQEWYRQTISPAPDAGRLRTLIGLNNPYPFGIEGPDYRKLAMLEKRGAAC